MSLDLETLVEQARKGGADEAEVFFQASKSTQIDVLDQKIESRDIINEQGVGIRIIKDKRLGFAYSSDLDPETLNETIERALKNADNTPPDEYNLLPLNPGRIEPLDLYDPQIPKINIDRKTELALQAEKAAYALDPRVKRTEKVSYSDSEHELSIFNSNGLDLSFRANSCGILCELIAEKDSQMENGFGLCYVRKIEDLIPENAGKEAASRACELLGARLINSQKLPLVLSPYVGAQLILSLSPILSSDNIQKGKSLFKGRLGKNVASSKVTLIDNGRLDDHLGSAPFDDEGVPTREHTLIETGVLKDFFYNTYTAKKEGKSSSGHGHRPSYQGLPGISPSNLYLKPGPALPELIIKKVKKGLYVTRVMGLHTINPITGEFSVGAAGILIEKGKKTYPVRGITISGDLIRLLGSIEEVGSDIRFFPLSANLGCPTLLIEGISVSGA